MKNIVFIDSGTGGLNVLKICDKLLTNQNFVYVADTFNAPYGNKSKKQLCQIAKNLVQFSLSKFHPKMIVLACNTLTVNAIKFLRKTFPSVQFVGVEPALKQAKIYGGDTVIMSTPATMKYYKKLNKKVTLNLKKEYHLQGLKFSCDDKVTKISCKNLASQIDENFENLNNLNGEIKSLFEKQKIGSIQNLVLGCTHYVAIKPQLQNMFKTSKIFDGTNGVAIHIKELLNNEKYKKIKENKIKFISTNGNKNFEKKLKNYYLLLKK